MTVIEALEQELISIEKEYPGGSSRSTEIRKELEIATGEPASTGDWITAFWVRHKIYDYFGWLVPPGSSL